MTAPAYWKFEIQSPPAVSHANSQFLDASLREFNYANKNGFTNCSGPNCPSLGAASFKTIATRAHPIHSQIPPVNDAVHAAFKAKTPTTVWQYYKLVGVQAMPMNGPLPSGALRTRTAIIILPISSSNQ